MVTGLDLVKLQFAVAQANRCRSRSRPDAARPRHRCRLYAEDVRAGFLPAVGELLLFKPPEGLGVRVDSGVQSGDAITILTIR